MIQVAPCRGLRKPPILRPFCCDATSDLLVRQPRDNQNAFGNASAAKRLSSNKFKQASRKPGSAFSPALQWISGLISRLIPEPRRGRKPEQQTSRGCLVVWFCPPALR